MRSFDFKRTAPVVSADDELSFYLSADGRRWPISISYQVLQDLASSNGACENEPPLKLFKDYEEEIVAVAVKSIEVQLRPKPIHIGGNGSPWNV